MDGKMQLECKVQDYKILKEFPGNFIVTILLLCRGKCREKIYIIKNIKIIEVIPWVFQRSSFYCSVVENVGLIDILNASIRRLLICNMGWDKYLNKQDYKIFKETPWLFHRSSFYCSDVENVGLRYILLILLWSLKKVPEFSIVHHSTALSWKMSGWDRNILLSP